MARVNADCKRQTLAARTHLDRRGTGHGGYRPLVAIAGKNADRVTGSGMRRRLVLYGAAAPVVLALLL
jgi:hypothetical protein